MRKLISILFLNTFTRRTIGIFNQLKLIDGKGDQYKHQYQIEKLQQVLRLLPDIPYYENTSINLKDLNYSEFRKLPILTKDVIRNEGDKLINTKYDYTSKPYKNTSGGSTGEPVTFYRTRMHSQHGVANFYYANYLNGVDIYDFSVDLWGAERDMHQVKRKFNFISFLYNKIFLNTFVLSEHMIKRYIEDLNYRKPRFIKAYVHSIYDISKYINSNKIEIKFTPIIHCTTGPLYPEMKEEIKSAFNGAHVYSFYGSREVSAIATQDLTENRFKVLFDNIFLEILDKNNDPVNPGEEGEIVVTTLNNYYMPLIRYKIGDRAIKGDSNLFGCLYIENVLGRTLGVIYTHDGRRIDGQFFTTLFFNRKGVKNFQLVQYTIDKLELRIVKDQDFSEEEIKSITSRIKKELGDVDIELLYVEHIDLTTTGKRMYVYSHLQSN